MSTGTGIDDDLLTRASSLASENGAGGKSTQSHGANPGGADSASEYSCYSYYAPAPADAVRASTASGGDSGRVTSEVTQRSARSAYSHSEYSTRSASRRGDSDSAFDGGGSLGPTPAIGAGPFIPLRLHGLHWHRRAFRPIGLFGLLVQRQCSLRRLCEYG